MHATCTQCKRACCETCCSFGCLEECATLGCSLFICVQCPKYACLVKDCDRCMCPNHSTHCADCRQPLCDEHERLKRCTAEGCTKHVGTEACAECKAMFCHQHLAKCSACKGILKLCPSDAQQHLPCRSCTAIVCMRQDHRCSIEACKQRVCPEHAAPTTCEHGACVDHAVTCAACNKVVCVRCAQQCAFPSCELWHCKAHLPACALCPTDAPVQCLSHREFVLIAVDETGTLVQPKIVAKGHEVKTKITCPQHRATCPSCQEYFTPAKLNAWHFVLVGWLAETRQTLIIANCFTDFCLYLSSFELISFFFSFFVLRKHP